MAFKTWEEQAEQSHKEAAKKSGGWFSMQEGETTRVQFLAPWNHIVIFRMHVKFGTGAYTHICPREFDLPGQPPHQCADCQLSQAEADEQQIRTYNYWTTEVLHKPSADEDAHVVMFQYAYNSAGPWAAIEDALKAAAEDDENATCQTVSIRLTQNKKGKDRTFNATAGKRLALPDDIKVRTPVQIAQMLIKRHVDEDMQESKAVKKYLADMQAYYDSLGSTAAKSNGNGRKPDVRVRLDDD